MANQTHQAGFTFIEVLIVVGIISVLAGACIFFDVNSYRGVLFRAQRATLVTQLQTARADALNNVGQQAHTVIIHPDGYALAPGSLTEVTFEQLSGDVFTSGDIILVDQERHATASISINHEGRIQ